MLTCLILLYLLKYKGFDPETDGNRNIELNDTGISSTTYQLGINLKF